MTITISFYQDGIYSEECKPIIKEMNRLKKAYANRTDNFTTIRSREAQMYNEKIEEQINKMMEYPQPNGSVTVDYSELNKDTKLQFIRQYYSNKSTLHFLKQGEDPDFLSDRCYIDINRNALKTFDEMGYEEGDILYLENFPKIRRENMAEILSETYDYTFFQDTALLHDTKAIHSASGLDKIIASIPIKSTEGDKTYINRRRRRDKKKEKLSREKKEKQGPGKNLVELKR